MAARGVDESETTLIALGDMAFDSPRILGEPARSLGISCNTCHNKSITNPNFFIPGISSRKGSVDVSSSFFAPHANNGLFDPVDIPDLRGIRFTAPYARNGRFSSLLEFTRNAIINEFNGPEPDPMIVDAIVAYMNEFEFLPNPKLNKDGTLNHKRASVAALRGEKFFRREFPQMMGGRSCASCHIPSALFLDHKQHNIGSAKGGFHKYSHDGAFDTPTLLSARSTPPYFHDSSLPTLRAVNEWFNKRFNLGLTKREVDDLTAYVETVSDGIEPYEDSIYTLEPELEEFKFFLSTYEFLKARGKKKVITVLLRTVVDELQAHKWDVQDRGHLPILNKMESLLREALAAHTEGKTKETDAKVAAYRALYKKNAEKLK
jgi:cytochrome c peroxidase